MTPVSSQRRTSEGLLRWLVPLLLAIIAAAQGGCSREHQPTPDSGPVLLFAIDGLEWRVLQPLLEHGELPFIKSLASRGAIGLLDSMEPTLSPVIWTSVATGRPPEEHGIQHFVYQEGQGAETRQRYYTSTHRRTKAFWNILSDYDRRVLCIGWWMTYPAEPINGVMVSQANTVASPDRRPRVLWKGGIERGVEGQVYPLDFESRVIEILGEVEASLDDRLLEIFGSRPHPPSELAEAFWEQTRWAFRADATYLRVAHELLESGDPFDLLALYLGGTDVVAHRFWRYAYPEEFEYPPDVRQIENFRRVIDDYYRYVDFELGRLAQAAPVDSTVVLLSDHGIRPINTELRVQAGDPPRRTNSAHHREAPPGVLVAAGPAIREPAGWPASPTSGTGTPPSVGGILDVLPTLLALMQVPVGEDLSGEVLESLLRPGRLGASPPRYVETHETEGWSPGETGTTSEPLDEEERLDQLRSLGYIE